MLDNTTTNYETITVENFVDRLQKNWEMLTQLDYVIFDDDSLLEKVFPIVDPINIDKLDKEEDKPLLIGLIKNLFGSSNVTSDLNLLEECDYLNNKWMEIGKVVHQQCEFGLFSFDFGDKLSDEFTTLISERIKKFIEIGLTTETDKKWSKFINLHNHYIDDDGDSISNHFNEYWIKSNDVFKDSFLKDFEIVINLYEKMMNTVDKHTKRLLGSNEVFDYSNFYNLTNDVISHLEGKYKIELYS